MATSQNTCFNHLHFRDCETETWRHSVTRSTFHSKRVAELGFDSECDPKASSLNHGDALIFFFSLSSICACMLSIQSRLTLHNPRDCSPPGSSVHGDSPGKSTGVGCRAFLQGIFPAQGSNPGFPHCRQILYHLSHQISPLLSIPFL